MDVFLLILAVILALTGILGAIIPGLPGPPIGFAGLLLVHLTSLHEYSMNFLGIMGSLALFITLLDYYVPIYGTKKFGGSKAGVRGSTIGLLIGVFVFPILGIVIGPYGLLGIILGPFAGAYVGEKMSGTSDDKAWRAAFGSFLGFIAGTLMKLIYGLLVAFYVVRDITYIILK